MSWLDSFSAFHGDAVLRLSQPNPDPTPQHSGQFLRMAQIYAMLEDIKTNKAQIDEVHALLEAMQRRDEVKLTADVRKETIHPPARYPARQLVRAPRLDEKQLATPDSAAEATQPTKETQPIATSPKTTARPGSMPSFAKAATEATHPTPSANPEKTPPAASQTQSASAAKTIEPAQSTPLVNPAACKAQPSSSAAKAVRTVESSQSTPLFNPKITPPAACKAQPSSSVAKAIERTQSTPLIDSEKTQPAASKAQPSSSAAKAVRTVESSQSTPLVNPEITPPAALSSVVESTQTPPLVYPTTNPSAQPLSSSSTPTPELRQLQQTYSPSKTSPPSASVLASVAYRTLPLSPAPNTESPNADPAEATTSIPTVEEADTTPSIEKDAKPTAEDEPPFETPTVTKETAEPEAPPSYEEAVQSDVAESAASPPTALRLVITEEEIPITDETTHIAPEPLIHQDTPPTNDGTYPEEEPPVEPEALSTDIAPTPWSPGPMEEEEVPGDAIETDTLDETNDNPQLLTTEDVHTPDTLDATADPNLSETEDEIASGGPIDDATSEQPFIEDPESMIKFEQALAARFEARAVLNMPPLRHRVSTLADPPTLPESDYADPPFDEPPLPMQRRASTLAAPPTPPSERHMQDDERDQYESINMELDAIRKRKAKVA